jgi:DNA replication and repair protein RecF
MHLQHLLLTNFRNYARLETDLQARVHVIEGDNAQGKTNLLEAIYYLATTRSPLASSDRELISWDALREVIPFARFGAAFTRGGRSRSLEATLVLERQEDDATAEPSLRRQLRLDGAPRRALDVVGQLNAVLFLPEDVSLVAGAPGERRRFLDILLCQVDADYCRALARYNRVVAQRNALLRGRRDGRGGADELRYWDDELCQLGATVLSRRLWAVRGLRSRADDLQRALTSGQEGLKVAYVSTLGGVATGSDVDEGSLARLLSEGLRQSRAQELARAVTLHGPHRDDLRLSVNGADMTIYGSRGQQRTVALALKLAEVGLMREQTGESPVVLLDDVISELDEHRGQCLLEAVAAAEQVLITTTSVRGFARETLTHAVRWRVQRGAVVPLATS